MENCQANPIAYVKTRQMKEILNGKVIMHANYICTCMLKKLLEIVLVNTDVNMKDYYFSKWKPFYLFFSILSSKALFLGEY